MDTDHGATITFKVEKEIRDIVFRAAKRNCVSVSEYLRAVIYRDGLTVGDKGALAMKARRDVLRADEDRLVSMGRKS